MGVRVSRDWTAQPCSPVPVARSLSGTPMVWSPEGHTWALGVCEVEDSDSDHLRSHTEALPALTVHGVGLPPEVEAAKGATHLSFGEPPRIHTDTAKDVLRKKGHWV